MTSSDTIYGRFHATALMLSDKPALLAADKTDTTFQQLLEFVESSASHLRAFGVNRRSRLGSLFLDRSQAAAAHLLSVSMCTAVPMNPNMTGDELQAIIQELKLDALLIGDETPTSLVDTARASGINVISTNSSSSTAGLFEITGGDIRTAGDRSAPSSEDIAVLLQTSGTTARRKIVPQSQASRVMMISRISRAMEISAEDRCMNMMPMHHTAGLTGEFLAPMVIGASVAFTDFNPAVITEMIEKFKPTWFNLVPSMHQAVVTEHRGQERVFERSSLRFIRSSSAKLSVSLRERLELTYGLPVLEFYGSSETGIMAFSGHPGTQFPVGSVGMPIHSGVQVMDESGSPLPAGARGEICASGPTVISAYENNAKVNAQSFWDGWYRTGDEGYFDDDGFLFVTGRIQEVANRGGEKFSLSEIDDVLMSLNGVSTAASFMASDQKLGNEVYAAVVLSPGSHDTASSLRAVLARRLSWAKIPKKVFVVQQLPMNSIGKVMRETLARQLVVSPGDEDHTTDPSKSAQL